MYAVFHGVISILRNGDSPSNEFIEKLTDCLLDMNLDMTEYRGSAVSVAVRNYPNVTYIYFRALRVPDLRYILWFLNKCSYCDELRTNDLHMIAYNADCKKFLYFFGSSVYLDGIGKRTIDLIHKDKFTLSNLHCLARDILIDSKWSEVKPVIDSLYSNADMRVKFSIKPDRDRLITYRNVSSCFSLHALNREDCHSVTKSAYDFFHK